MRIQSTRVWIGSSFQPAQLEISAKKIWSIDPYGYSRSNLVDFGNNRIVPGFIDIHCHGAYGFDTNDGKSDGLRTWARRLPEEGVTGFLPTTVTDDPKTTMKALRNVAETKWHLEDSAEIIGIHMEGPFLNTAYHGAQPEEFIIPPEIPLFREFQHAAENQILLMTLAPENDKDYMMTRFLRQNGVAVSIGHSAATFRQVQEACANGAVSITHTFNAQSGLHHRDNGVAGAALCLPELYSEIIGDGNHVSAEVVNLFYRCKGRFRPILVSDSLRCKGSPIGDTFLFAGKACVISPDGSARIAQTGKLAGSTLKINEGIRFLIEEAHVDEIAAWNSATLNPASMLGLADRLGKLQVGYDADITILDDRYHVIQTLCKGSFRLRDGLA